MKFLFIILCLLSTVTIDGITNNRLDQKMKIVWRFDDYQLKSNIFYDSLFYVFRKNNISLCLGVIPFNENEIIVNEMNQEQMHDLILRIRRGEIEIAIHGFNHHNNEIRKESFFIETFNSEFVGLNYFEQFDRISKSKKSIDSLLQINTNIFIPPHNSYDDYTLQVLDSLNFDIISAYINGPSSSSKLKYIPSTIDDLNELPKILKRNRGNSGLIVVTIHPYSFESGSAYPKPYKRIKFNQLDSLLNWISNQNYISSTSFSKLSKSEIFDTERFVLNSINKNLVTKSLNKMKLYRYGLFNTLEYEKSHLLIFNIFNILFHILTFLLVFYMSKIVNKMINSHRIKIVTFIIIFVLMLLAVLYHNTSYILTMKIVFMTTVSTAILLGTFVGYKFTIKT